MRRAPLGRRAAAEFLGTGLLVAVVIGSGILATRLSPGDAGVELLENAAATAAGLAVAILLAGVAVVLVLYPAGRSPTVPASLSTADGGLGGSAADDRPSLPAPRRSPRSGRRPAARDRPRPRRRRA